MREYGQVQCAFWQSNDFRSIAPNSRLLALYLLTGPHSNGIGCYRLPDGYVMADLAWVEAEVESAFAELSAIHFAYRFDGVVLIPTFLRWNSISNGNVGIARFSEWNCLPKGNAKNGAAESMLAFGAHWKAEHVTILEAAMKGFHEPEKRVSDGRQEPPRTTLLDGRLEGYANQNPTQPYPQSKSKGHDSRASNGAAP